MPRPESAREHCARTGHSVSESIDEPWTCHDCSARAAIYDMPEPSPAVDVNPVPNQVRPSDVLIVGARITPELIDTVRVVEGALVAAVIAAFTDA